ncbi:MAG: hypothetical protein LIR46_05270 [Bacteroidota bacterium]|nr:hypothetical protein [Bacteroidota bacterium]
MKKFPKNKVVAVHSFDDADYIIVPDTLPIPSCNQCCLSTSTCGQICMNEGCRYHVQKVIQYRYWTTLFRKVKFFMFNHY